MKQFRLLNPIWLAAIVLLLSVSSLTANAYDFMVDGIAYTYNSNGTSVTVTSTVPEPWNGGNYNGLTTANIPSSVTYDGTTYSVTSIGNYAFYGCSGLTSVTIGNSVTSIGGSAFECCSGLTSIDIPNSVTSIGNVAFKACSGLTSIDIPNSVTSIGNVAFKACSGLTSVTIGNSVTSIGDGAFEDCSGLTSITIPNSVTSIGRCAFSGCHSLESIVVENGNSTYDSRDNCNAIIETATNTLISGCKNTIIPNSVTSIGDFAFWMCSGLTSVTIPNSVISIGYRAFNGCSGLTSVIIPNSVISIGSYAFCGCSGLTSVTIGNSVTSISDSAFWECSGLTSVTIPNSVTSIGSYAFCSCYGLTSVTIPNSVTSIDNYAFSNCIGLTNVTLTGYGSWNYNSSKMQGLRYIINNKLIDVSIGSGITSLGNFGFTPDVVNCYAEVPPSCSSNTFASYDGVLHVPASSLADYFIADYWQNFTNINNDITEKVALNTTSATLIQHEELQLTATATPNGSAIVWSSTNQNVAIVDNNGKVTAMGQGDCYIHATLASNPAVYASCHITASYPEITSLTLSETELVFNQAGDTITLIAITTPANSGPKPTWTSSDETVATVNANGLVTAINLGECDITATVLNQSATCHVTVTSAIIITLDMTSATIAPNEILTLTPSFNPTETDIVATSSDANVAFARAITQNGFKKVQVLGVAEGSATITVASVDGKAIPATCVVTVSNAPSVIMGDANGDGTVNVSDVSALINMILGITPMDQATGDVNGDSRVNVSDVSALINIILGIH